MVALNLHSGIVSQFAILHEAAHHFAGVGTGEGHGMAFRCMLIVLYSLYKPDVVPNTTFTEL